MPIQAIPGRSQGIDFHSKCIGISTLWSILQTLLSRLYEVAERATSYRILETKVIKISEL